MKRKIFVMFVILLILLAFTSCEKSYETRYKNGEVNVLNIDEYIDEDLVRAFEETYDIKVNYTIRNSCEEMYVDLKTSEVNYDVAFPSDYMVEKLIEEDMIQELNFKHIPNYEYIMQETKNRSFDPENKYTVPYFWGTLGLLYNKSMVSEKVDSWKILWDSKYKDKILLHDSQRDSMTIALKLLGYSLNSENEKELLEARKLLIEQRPLVKAYSSDITKQSMIEEKGALAVVYSGDAVYSMRHNENLEYIIPKEGSNTWIDSMVIPVNAENVKNAEKFINYMSDPQNAYRNCVTTGFATTNKKAKEMLTEELKSEIMLSVEIDDLINNEIYASLPTDVASVYDEIWTEVLETN